MKKNAYILLFLLSSLEFGSCADTVQVDMKEGLENVRIAPINGSLAVSLKTSTREPAKKGSIIEAESFALFSDGKRYGVIVEPNEYARNYPEKSYFTSDYIWLKGDHGGKLNWKDGDWKFVLVLQSTESKVTYKAKFGLKAHKVSLLDTNGEF